MEDGVTDSERLVLPSKLNSKVGAKQEEANDFEPEKNEKDEERAGGLISNLISNLVPRSVAEAGEEDNGGDTENRNRISEGKDEEKEGGFINHLISNLVSPLSPRPREVNEGKVEVENGEKSSDGGGWCEKKVVMEGGGGSAGGGGSSTTSSPIFLIKVRKMECTKKTVKRRKRMLGNKMNRDVSWNFMVQVDEFLIMYIDISILHFCEQRMQHRRQMRPPF
ncbi:hypothetical protein CK203_063564 [Vitis vinifera]|uniref:Uncharacterized protein n=1 Tax=Vitis vinifera TaxID=29760 RepID=A0A438GC29_VITVI|nr:hypothetical protein CK203_063564 [Vitis vinifera]